MSEMKFTPGWKTFISGKVIEVQDYMGLTIVSWKGFDDCRRSLKEHKANARLIAAAPDLYRELNRAVEIHRHECIITCPETCWCWDADDALAKAEGKQ